MVKIYIPESVRVPVVKAAGLVVVGGSLLLNSFGQSMTGKVVSAMDGLALKDVNVSLSFEGYSFSTKTNQDGFYNETITNVKDNTDVDLSKDIIHVFPSGGKNKRIQMHLPDRGYELFVSDVTGRAKLISDNLKTGFSEIPWSSDMASGNYFFMLVKDNKITDVFPSAAIKDNVLPPSGNYSVLEKKLGMIRKETKKNTFANIKSGFVANMSFKKSGYHDFIDAYVEYGGDGSGDLEYDVAMFPKRNLQYSYEPWGLPKVRTLLDMFKNFNSADDIADRVFRPPKMPIQVYIDDSFDPFNYSDEVRDLIEHINFSTGELVFQEVDEPYQGGEFSSVDFQYVNQKTFENMGDRRYKLERSPVEQNLSEATISIVASHDLKDSLFANVARPLQKIMYNGNAFSNHPNHVAFDAPYLIPQEYSQDEMRLWNVVVRIPDETKINNYK